MANILLRTRGTNIKWKTFEFPLSIKNFSLKEGAKIATYEYAGRNGAEHERVLSHRVFSVSGEFMAGIGNKEPKKLVYDLRLTNDNKPGTFIHSDIGVFNCIMSNLTIDQTGEGYTTMDDNTTQLTPSFSFSFELLESTPPNSKTLSEKNNELYPKANVKPTSDIYNSALKYKNSEELFNAIITGKIAPGVNPVINAEWLKYDYDMRKVAYDKWKATGFSVGVTNVDAITTNTNQRSYIVKAGDTGTKIAKQYKVPFTSLYESNRGVKVRKNPNGTEGLYWKTSRLLYAGDKLIIPNS